MTFFQIDPLNLIPASLRTAMRDSLVDFVSDLAKKYLGDEISNKLKKLRSDAAFNKKFEEGLQRAIKRFEVEYELQDEDLVVAITAQPDFFHNEEVQKSLLAVLKQPGASLVDEQDTLTQSFQSLLPERRNRDRVNKAVMYLLKCLAEELWHLQELQPIYSLEFQHIIAETTRQQVELQKAQLLTLTELNAGVRDALLQLIDAIAERKLLPSSENFILPDRPKVLHNLPQPDYGQFIGREEEIRQICRILKPYPHSQSHLVTIDGIGGIGKSALALEVAYHYLHNYDKIPHEERFDAIIWISAKQSVLTGEGIKTRYQALRTLEDFYTTISITLQREDITRSRSEDQSEVTRNALVRQRTLLIADNLETVDDENVMVFLRELPAPTKAIVTTRHRIDVAYPVRLTGMPWNDVQRLIAQECKKKEVNLTNEEARQLYDRTGGVPLAIVWSISQMGFGYGVEAVLQKLGQTTSDIAKFCFEAAMTRIRNKPSHKLFVALSIFASHASRDALKYVTNLPEIDCNEGLVELVNLSLVNKTGANFSILPLTRRFALNEFETYPEFSKGLNKRKAEYYIIFLSQHKLGIRESLMSIGEELANITELLDFLIASAEFDLIVEIFQKYYVFLWRQGHWTQGIKLVIQVLEWAIASKNLQLEAQCNHWLGRLYLYQGRYSEAEKRLEYAIRLCTPTDWRWKSVTTYYAQALLRQNRIDEAFEVLDRAKTIAMEQKDYRGATRIHNGLAEIEMRKNNFDAALNYLQIGFELALAGQNEQTTILGRNFYLRGVIEREKSEFDQAEKWILKFKDIAFREGFVQEVAQADLELAKIALQKGDLEHSSQFAGEAKYVFDRLGMSDELKDSVLVIEASVN